MATETLPKPPRVAQRPTSASDGVIDRQLRRTQFQVRVVDIFVSLVVWMVAVLASLLLLALCDHWIVSIGTIGRWLALLALVAGSGYYFAVQLGPLLWRRINSAYAAKVIEDAEPSLKNSLLNFLLLRGNPAGVPEVVVDALRERAASDLTHTQIDQPVDRTPLIRLGYILCGVMVVFAAYKLLSPKDPFRTVARVLAPWADIARPSRVHISKVEPGDADVYQGQTVTITAHVDGQRSSDPVEVIYSTADGQTLDATAAMSHVAGMEHSATLPPGPSESGMQQDVVYRVRAGDAESPEYRLHVLPSPRIDVERIELQFPAYTNRSPQTLANQGDIRAVEGTQVTIHAKANQEITSAYIEFDPSPNVPARRDNTLSMQAEGAAAKAVFRLERLRDGAARHTTYQIRLRSAAGLMNDRPTLHRIEALADLPPEIEVLAPMERRLELPANRTLKFELRGRDPDFGLCQIALELSNGEQPLQGVTLFELSGGQLGPANVSYVVDPQKLGLQPGDDLTLVGVAEDNRHDAAGEAAANVSRTDRYVIHITPPEVQQQRPSEEPMDNEAKEDEPPPMPKPGEQEKPTNSQKPQPKPNEKTNENSDEDQQDKPQKNNGTENKPGEKSTGSSKKEERKPGQSKQEESKPGEKNENEEKQAQSGGAGGGDSEEQQEGGDEGSEGASGSQSQGGKPQGKQPGSKTSSGAAGENSSGESAEGTESTDEGNSGNEGANSPSGSKKNTGQNPSTGDKPGENSGEPSDAGEAGESAGTESQSESRSTGSQGNSAGQQRPKHDGEAIEQIKKELEKNPDLKKQREKENGENQPGGEPTDNENAANGQNGANSGRRPQNNAGKPGEQTQPQPGQEREGEPSDAGNEKNGSENTGTENGSAGQPKPGERANGAQKPKPQPGQNPNQQPMPSQTPENGEGDSVTGQQNSDQGAQPGSNKTPSPMSGGDKQPGDKGQPQKPGEGDQSNPGSGEKPEKPNPAGQSQEPSQQRDKTAKPNEGQNESGDETSASPSSKKESDSQGGTSGDQKGGGKQGPGQSAKQPGQDSPGSTSSSDEGAGKSNEEGKGETGPKAGKGEKSERPTGQSGKEEGPGSGQKPGEKGTKPDGSKSGEGAGNKAGQPMNPQRDPSKGRPSGDIARGGGQASEGEPVEGGPRREVADTEAENLEYAKKSTDLALKYLKDQKDNPDPELLKKLGWTKDDLNAFLQRWESLKSSAKEGGEAKEELNDAYRSLGLRPATDKRRSAATGDDALRGNRDAGARREPPPGYAEQFKAFRKRGEK